MPTSTSAPESGEESTERKSGGGLTLDDLDGGDRVRYDDPRDGEEHEGAVFAISKSGDIRVFNQGYVDIGISEVVEKLNEDADDERTLPETCAHEHVRRKPRRNGIGNVVIEARCLDCKQVLNPGGAA